MSEGRKGCAGVVDGEGALAMLLDGAYDLAILESGNALASIYFMQPVSDRPAFMGELLSDDRNRRFLDGLVKHEGIDYIAYRVGDSVLGVRSRDGEVLLDYSRTGSMTVSQSGANPLQFDTPHGPTSLLQSIDLTRGTDYPDSVVQLQQLFASCRTGDIVVFPKEGFDLRARYEWPEHKSSHGSLLKAHMEVPICTNLKLESTSCRTVDVFPTVLRNLGLSLRNARRGSPRRAAAMIGA